MVVGKTLIALKVIYQWFPNTRRNRNLLTGSPTLPTYTLTQDFHRKRVTMNEALPPGSCCKIGGLKSQSSFNGYLVTVVSISGDEGIYHVKPVDPNSPLPQSLSLRYENLQLLDDSVENEARKNNTATSRIESSSPREILSEESQEHNETPMPKRNSLIGKNLNIDDSQSEDGVSPPLAQSVTDSITASTGKKEEIPSQISVESKPKTLERSPESFSSPMKSDIYDETSTCYSSTTATYLESGTQAYLLGLTSKPYLNGKLVTIVEFYPEQEKYHVTIPNQEGFDTSVILVHRENLILTQSHDNKSQLRPNGRALVENFRKVPELNGHLVIIVRYDRALERYKVRPIAKDTMKITGGVELFIGSQCLKSVSNAAFWARMSLGGRKMRVPCICSVTRDLDGTAMIQAKVDPFPGLEQTIPIAKLLLGEDKCDWENDAEVLRTLSETHSQTVSIDIDNMPIRLQMGSLEVVIPNSRHTALRDAMVEYELIEPTGEVVPVETNGRAPVYKITLPLEEDEGYIECDENPFAQETEKKASLPRRGSACRKLESHEKRRKSLRSQNSRRVTEEFSVSEHSAKDDSLLPKSRSSRRLGDELNKSSHSIKSERGSKTRNSFRSTEPKKSARVKAEFEEKEVMGPRKMRSGTEPESVPREYRRRGSNKSLRSSSSHRKLKTDYDEDDGPHHRSQQSETNFFDDSNTYGMKESLLVDEELEELENLGKNSERLMVKPSNVKEEGLSDYFSKAAAQHVHVTDAMTVVSELSGPAAERYPDYYISGRRMARPGEEQHERNGPLSNQPGTAASKVGAKKKRRSLKLTDLQGSMETDDEADVRESYYQQDNATDDEAIAKGDLAYRRRMAVLNASMPNLSNARGQCRTRHATKASPHENLLGSLSPKPMSASMPNLTNDVNHCTGFHVSRPFHDQVPTDTNSKITESLLGSLKSGPESFSRQNSYSHSLKSAHSLRSLASTCPTTEESSSLPDDEEFGYLPMVTSIGKKGSDRRNSMRAMSRRGSERSIKSEIIMDNLLRTMDGNDENDDLLNKSIQALSALMLQVAAEHKHGEE